MGFDRPLIATGLHHDARLPPQHLPGRHRDSGPELRKRFKGQPEHVVNFFFFVAEEARKIMAGCSASARRRADRPRRPARDRRRGRPLEGRAYRPHAPAGLPRIDPGAAAGPRRRRPVLDDNARLEADRSGAGRSRRDRRRIETEVRDHQPLRRRHHLERDRQRARARAGCPTARSTILRGSAGQSFGGWLMPGITFTSTATPTTTRQGPCPAAPWR